MADQRSHDDSPENDQSKRSSHSHHHHRHRKRKRRRSRNHGGSIKSVKDGMLMFAMIAAFVVALGFCLWMIVPPLIQYLSQSTNW